MTDMYITSVRIGFQPRVPHLEKRETIMSFAPAVFQALPRRFDSLANSLDRLGNALGRTVPGNEWEWANAVGSALGHMEAALREHRASAKAPNGALAG